MCCSLKNRSVKLNLAGYCFYIFGLLGVFMPSIALAQLEVSGFADSYHAAGIESPHDILSSRNRVRVETETNFDQTHLFVSLNAIQNGVIEEQTGIELREAYFDYVSDSWDMRIGRQIIIWGKADGVRISDIVSPSDLTEFIARDFDDTRIPVDAFKVRFLSDMLNVEFIWLPQFQSGILPKPGTPWAVSPNINTDKQVSVEAPVSPDKTLGNGEVGLKLSFYLPGIDLSISSFYTRMDFALAEGLVENDTLHISQRFYRYGFVGFDMSVPLGDFVVRGDMAFNINLRHQTANAEYAPLKRHALNALIGLDWYPGNDWTISGQLSDNYIMNHHPSLSAEQHSPLITLSLTKMLSHNTIKLSSFSYIGLENNDLFNRSSVDVALTDELHLIGGVDVFLGDSGTFGQFQDNSELWVKAKYSF